MLYVAVLLHDIAKGRGGDHSEIGAEIALRLAPRFGLDPAETETVSWLVRYHLLLSSTAFKRDLADPKTIEDFVRLVQSPERLRLLLALTVVDIRAVGPGVWSEWKRTLLRTLFEAAEERLRLGHKQHGRSELVTVRQKELAAELGWKASAIRAHSKRLPDSYWLAEPLPWQVSNALQVATAEAHIGDARPSVIAEDDRDSGATRISVFTPDREGLFYRICAGLASAGANIIDARIHTTRDGMALDNLLVLDGRSKPYPDKKLRGRLVKAVEAALLSDEPPPLPAPAERPKSAAFKVPPSVAIADRASTRTTVVEVNAHDRAALLAGLANAIHRCGHRIHSAHIATYGERAVDVFYLTRSDGKKLGETDSEQLRDGVARRRPRPRLARRRLEAALGCRWRRRRWWRRRRAGVGRQDHRTVRASLRRRRRRRRWRRGRRRRRQRLTLEAKPAAQGHAERPRLGEELREDLPAARERRVDERSEGEARGPWRGGRSALLERRVERDLRIVLVEQILRPQLDRPAILGALDADAAVDDRVGVLTLLREQVRAGVVVARDARIDVEQSPQPARPDRRGPGQRARPDGPRRVGDAVAGQYPKRRAERRAVVPADEIVAVFGVGVGQAEVDRQIAHRLEGALELDTGRADAVADVLTRAGARARRRVDVERRAGSDHRRDEVRAIPD